MKVSVIIPSYNDWECLELLISNLETIKDEIEFDYYIIDDASNQENTAQFNTEVNIIRLNQNVGHQRAIAIGLSYMLNKKNLYDFNVVMDADGEDRPQDVPILIEESQRHNKITFAQRKKRNESFSFKFFYKLYKSLFRTLVGKDVDFGNFSVIPKEYLSELVMTAELWNHYSATVIKTRIPFHRVPCDRGKRYFGNSKMNLSNLFLHGLSAISVHMEIVSVRLLMSSLLFVVFIFGLSVSIILLRVFTDVFVSGWASTFLILIFILGLIAFVVALILCLTILINRSTVREVPYQFYHKFLARDEH